MKLRYLSVAAAALVTAAVVSTRACGQQPTAPPPGVRLGLSYPAGTTPKVIVMPVDSTPGDSVRALIQRDLDYSDQITPLVLDDMTLMGMTPAPGQPYNFSLFSNLGAAAIIEAKRSSGGFLVSLYDVSTQKKLGESGCKASRFRNGCNDYARKSGARFSVSHAQGSS